MKVADDMRVTGDGVAQSNLTEQAKEKVSDATEQVKSKAGEAAEQAKGAVRQQIDQRATEVGEKIRSQAELLQGLSRQLREDGKDSQAQMLDKACEQVTKLSDYLERSDSDRILSDIEGFARKQPWAFAAAAFGVGLIGSRFLKASSEQRYSGSQQQRSTSGPSDDAESYGSGYSGGQW